VGLGLSVLVPPGPIASVFGIALGGGVLFLLRWLWLRATGVEGMGLGDVKMLAMIGAFIGWQLTIVTLMMASVAGSIVGVIVIVSRKGDMKYALPFGTFLAMGAALAATVGPDLLGWYLGFWGPL